MRIERIRMSDYPNGKGVPPIKLSVNQNISVNLEASIAEMDKPLNIEKMAKQIINKKVADELVRIGAITREYADQVLKEMEDE